ncbi:MAG: TadE/TadG family type IV pilus assembly protein [Acidipropionibacterium acidipropionici]|uniref:TadE/TadG family type IV pilus assembly protein n=1 Tax=Acidipropionibacterium acidipropionici TaxID=1748 RepID=UPI002F35C125
MHRRDERGVVESVQWALVWPVMLLAVFGIIQAAVLLQARSAVTEAARAAVRAETLAGSHPGDALDAAWQVAGPSGVRDITVTVGRSGPLTTVEVRARAPILLDLASTPLSARAVGVREGT